MGGNLVLIAQVNGAYPLVLMFEWVGTLLYCLAPSQLLHVLRPYPSPLNLNLVCADTNWGTPYSHFHCSGERASNKRVLSPT